MKIVESNTSFTVKLSLSIYFFFSDSREIPVRELKFSGISSALLGISAHCVERWKSFETTTEFLMTCWPNFLCFPKQMCMGSKIFQYSFTGKLNTCENNSEHNKNSNQNYFSRLVSTSLTFCLLQTICLDDNLRKTRDLGTKNNFHKHLNFGAKRIF